MSDLSWRDAVVEVLRQSSEAMHYADIADAITEQKLRIHVGATPAQSVSYALTTSLNKEGPSSPFIRVAPGRYALRDAFEQSPPATRPLIVETKATGLINALGMFWARSKVHWTSNPRILGQQQEGSTPVDFAKQKGVYLLHDGRAVVYVGRATDQLATRLRQHVSDRLSGRWDRFSWFGIYPVVADSGDLDVNALDEDLSTSLAALIVTMEALLIEGLEPPQNRKRGDDFRAVEFLQVEDPEIRKKNVISRLMDELKTSF